MEHKTNKMNKQQLLDSTVATPGIVATQQLVIRMSKTKLEATRRAFKEVNETLYKTEWKQLPFAAIVEAVNVATKLASGETIEDKEIHISTEAGKK